MDTHSKDVVYSLFVFLLKGFDGIEAAGGADLDVAGVFSSEEKTFWSDKDIVIKKNILAV